MNTLFLFLSLITFVISPYGLTPEIPDGYTIAPWYKFKPSVITYSYDDGSSGHLKTAIPLMDKYNFKGSINLITSLENDFPAYKIAAENGHEITSHTVTHPNLSELPLEKQESEIAESKFLIEEKIGQEVITLVYPYCVPGDEDLAKKYYISGRHCYWDYISPNPDNMFNLPSFGIGNESSVTTAEDMNELVNNALEKKSWIVFLIHGIDDDGGYSFMDSKELEKHFQYVKESDQFWVGTFRDVSKYILEANSLVIKEVETARGSFIKVDTKYKTSVTKLNFPVTISKTFNCFKPSIKDTELLTNVEFKLQNGKVIFDVVPGQEYLIQCED